MRRYRPIIKRKSLQAGVALLLCCGAARGQDTFSILAFDSLTNDVGAAGASCVDLFTVFGVDNHFICELLPDTGAIATQAAYDGGNQLNARKRMRLGEKPTQIMQWLQANDVGNNPAIRQYGAVMIGKYPTAAAFTGTGCTDYKGHIIGPNYTIHGNILLGKEILDSMEFRFKSERGDLACKLMAALQGAKKKGADTRCAQYNTSSLFAFLKVMQPTDTFGKPSFLISLRTHKGAMIEPIDSLQRMFTARRTCTYSDVGVPDVKAGEATIRIWPDADGGSARIRAGRLFSEVVVTDALGREVGRYPLDGGEARVVLSSRGLYFMRFSGNSAVVTRKLVVP